MTAEISKIRKNIMGTTSFDMKIQGMRKFQDFIIYPMHNESKEIKIQSSTRMGIINLETGKGKMSKSHSSGAYFIHLQIDPLTDFQLSEMDLSALKMQIFVSGGKDVGESFVKTDNSGAFGVL
jgi:hypothetical protein